MTINELIQQLEPLQGKIALALIALPLATYILGAILQKGSRRLTRYLLAVAIYLAVIPGMCMAVIILYMLLFVRANLLQEVHVVLHLLPVVSMPRPIMSRGLKSGRAARAAAMAWVIVQKLSM